MAVKWAVANGNWNAGATWNDGLVPTSEDDVYLNGYNVTHPNALNYLTAKSITNALNPNTNIQGGLIIGGYSYQGQVTKHFFIAANIICDAVGLPLFGVISSTQICHINGNVSVINGSLCTGTNNKTIEVNGNVTCDDTLVAASASATITLTINGNLSLSRNCNCTTATLTSLKTEDCLLITTILNINDAIEYTSNSGNKVGFQATTFNILNPDTFTWKDVTEPRSNPFIIVTDAEMNNRQQYPPENEVKEGTEYVWGEKVGTYQQPPESVVLKDYEYDTITAEENDIATYNLVRYIYATYGTLHWFELKTTTTDIVTDPTQQSISIDGETVVADTDYVVEYNDACYQWSGSAWGSITAKNIGTVKTDIVTNPTETTLGVKKGTLETIPQVTLSRMQNTLTVDIFQQILDAHLNN